MILEAQNSATHERHRHPLDRPARRSDAQSAPRHWSAVPAGGQELRRRGGAPTTDLYDNDIVFWREQQADLLRRRAAGERMNDAEIDWPNVAEEIEDVGKCQRSRRSNRI